MKIRKTTSVALAAVAAAAFTLPTASFAQAQAAPAPAGQSIASCTPGNSDLELEVSPTKIASIEEALKIAKECGHAEKVTIRVASASSPAVLPNTIPAGFKQVVITGAQNRNVTVSPAVNGTTEVKSPTEIRYIDLNLNQPGVPTLVSHSSLVVTNSLITGFGVLVGDSKVSRVETAKAEVSFIGNTFDGVQAINTGRGYKKVNVVDNTFNVNVHIEQRPKDVNVGVMDVVVLAPTADSTVKTSIKHNRFVAARGEAGRFVTVMRPNVTIEDNSFTSAEKESVGVFYEVPSRAGRNRYVMATNLSVTNNVFVMDKPVVQDQSSLPRDNAEVERVNKNKRSVHVRVSKNRFESAQAPVLVFAQSTVRGLEFDEGKIVVSDNEHAVFDLRNHEGEHEVILEED